MRIPIVIHEKCLPTRLPIWSTATAWLLCDRFHIPTWGWGVFWTLHALLWVVCIALVFAQEKRVVPGFGE